MASFLAFPFLTIKYRLIVLPVDFGNVTRL